MHIERKGKSVLVGIDGKQKLYQFRKVHQASMFRNSLKAQMNWLEVGAMEGVARRM